MSTITSANSKVVFNVPDVVAAVQPISGYAADDMFAQEAIVLGETRMGADGLLSGGMVPSGKKWSLTLQPDSPSWPFFRNWAMAILAQKEQFPDGSSITVDLPSIGETHLMSKLFFINYAGMPSGKKLLDPVKMDFEYQDISSGPL